MSSLHTLTYSAPVLAQQGKLLIAWILLHAPADQQLRWMAQVQAQFVKKKLEGSLQLPFLWYGCLPIWDNLKTPGLYSLPLTNPIWLPIYIA